MADPTMRSPLLDDDRGKSTWVEKLVDVEETKAQIIYSLPMIFTNVFYYCIPLTSVMFASHLGQLELAGATLANSFATVSGYAFMMGLSGALETLCGQNFGGKNYRMLGIHLQSACVVTLVFGILITIVWFFTEPIFVFLKQDPSISKQAALYMMYLSPGLVAFGFLQNILRFCQTQSIINPLLIFSFIPLVVNVGASYVLVHIAGFGFIGAPIATSISTWIAVLSLGVYVIYSENFKETWTGFSFESFHYLVVNLALSIPSATMVCLEYWAFEILVFMAGVMPNPEINTSLVAICVTTESISYMLTYGLSAAASTRVSNELGAGNIQGAKKATAVSVKLSLVLALGVVIAILVGHDLWVGLYSNSLVIKEAFASMKFFLAASITLDSIQGVLSGVARGCGWQNAVTVINLGTFYMIGMPIAAFCGFKLKLYAKGLWIGMICGIFCQSSSLLLMTIFRKWRKLTDDATYTVCNSLEYWLFEILVFLAGLMPNPEINTSLVAICVNTESISYMLTYGLSAAASTRVFNELGAGNVKGAKKATSVSVRLSLVLAIGVVIAILVGHDGWVGLFSNSLVIKYEFASLRFFLAASITLDSILGVLSGVARGCGWQRVVTVINLGTFYLIGMPIAAFCGFKLKFYAKGLWIGLKCGISCQSSCLLLMTMFRKWNAATV